MATLWHSLSILRSRDRHLDYNPISYLPSVDPWKSFSLLYSSASGAPEINQESDSAVRGIAGKACYSNHFGSWKQAM